jgi:PAS domain S-box-containing protein
MQAGSANHLAVEDPVGRPIGAVLREAAQEPERVDDFLGALTRGGSASAELWMRTTAGPVRRMRLTGTYRAAPRALAGMVIDYQDVTLQHEALSQLKAQANILANMREAVIAADLAGNVMHWNQGAQRIFGYGPEEMLGQSLVVVYPNADPEQMRRELAAIAAGEDFDGDWEGRRKDGSTVIVDVHTSPMYGPDGTIIGFLGVSSDVTARRLEERRTQRLATAIEQSSEAVLIANRHGVIEYVNPAFERVTGWAASAAIGKNPRILKSGAQPHSYYRAMWDTLLAGRPWVADIVNRRRDGSLYEAETVISPIRDQAGETDGFVAVSRDVTEERRLQQQAQRLTRERALVAETLRELEPGATPEATAARICRQVASLTDVDFACLYVFSPGGKAVPYGFAFADGAEAPLFSLARARSGYLRARAELGPWIEEWRQADDHPYAKVFGQRGIRACAYAPVTSGEEVVGLLIIGSARENADEVLSAGLPALLEFADISASQVGPALLQRSQERVAREVLSRIIRRREFWMAYQPIIDIASGVVVGYEALARFDDGVPPDVRIAQAAALGRERELELALIRAAVAGAHELPHGRWLNVNASPQLITDRRLAPVLAAADREVVVEVTEHSAVSDYDAFRRAAANLGAHVRIAIDDAGAGFASLRHIIEIKPALVKLDRSLVHGMASDQARQALIAGLTHFASTSGIEVLAEGVEEPADLEALRQLNIRLAQGYLLGQPMPVTEALTHRLPPAVADGPPVSDQVHIVWPEVVHADGWRERDDKGASVVMPPLLLTGGRSLRAGTRSLRAGGRPAK